MTGPDTSRDLVALPRAVVLMLWAAAYLRGDVGPDDAAELSYGAGRAGRAGRGSGGLRSGRAADGTAGADAGVDLFDWLTGLRRLPLVQLRLALPVPGRITGLVGPPEAIAAALAQEQAIVVTAAGIADHTLVPGTEHLETPEGSVQMIAWERYDALRGAHLPPAASSGTAREELLRALRRAATSSVDLDLVPEEPVAPSRIPATWTATGLPRHVTAQDTQLLVLASRILLLTQEELVSEQMRTVGLSDELARRRLLEELRDAAREALVETVERVVQAETA